LIVDDEPLIRKGIIKLVDLAALSIGDVYEASNGEEALVLVHEKHPDIILADINMPGIDGLTLVKAIREENHNVRIAIITGYDYFDYALSAIKAGVDDYVLKPVSKNDISQLIKKLTEKIKASRIEYKLVHTEENIKQLEGEAEGLLYKKQIIKAVNENFQDTDFSLSRLAKLINLSQGYLSTVFKQLFGIPFQDYVHNFRLEKSKILLLSTSYKVYEIAEKTGFEDPNYFSSSFKKHYGISPNKFREQAGDQN